MTAPTSTTKPVPRWARGCEDIAKVVHVDCDAPFDDLAVDERYTHVMVVVHAGPTVLGQLLLPAPPSGTLTAGDLWTAVANAFGWPIWRERLRSVLRRRLLGEPVADGRPRPRSSVSVVVCTRDRPEQLQDCLDALLALDRPADEIVVVDNCPSDDRTELLCRAYPVTYVREPVPGQARARNRGINASRGELVAFTDDDCIPGRGWLTDIEDSFVDPLVMAVTGYIGPVELESPAQFLFEGHYGFGRSPERRVLDWHGPGVMQAAASAGAGANMIFRREVFGKAGMFAEDLCPGTPARSGDDKYCFFRVARLGYRILQEPSRQVWHRHRADFERLRRIMNDYGVAELAMATRCIVADRELAAVRMWSWWAAHFRDDLRAIRRRTAKRIPLRLTLAELSGALVGPVKMLQSRWSRRGIPPIRYEPPAAGLHEERVPGPVSVEELPALSVVVPTYNRREDVRQLVESLAAQDYPRDLLELVVVDDGSRDGTAEMVEAAEPGYRIRLLRQSNQGVAVARNRGVREATSAFVVFLDDDIRPEPQFLMVHASSHRDRGDRVVLGYCPPAEPANDLWSIELRNWWEDHYRVKDQPNHPWTFLDCSGGNLSLRRELYLDVGGYDEDFAGAVRSDWELGARLLKAGIDFTYRADATAWHHYVPSLASSLAKIRESGVMDLRLVRKHPHVVGLLPLLGAGTHLGSAEEPYAQLASSLWRARTRYLIERAPFHPWLEVLEWLNLRGRWHMHVNTLLIRAYALGVAEEARGQDEIRSVLARIRDEQDKTLVTVSLDDDERFELPADAGRVAIAIERGGRSLGCDWVHTRDHWDWDKVIAGLSSGAGEAARVRAALDAIG